VGKLNPSSLDPVISPTLIEDRKTAMRKNGRRSFGLHCSGVSKGAEVTIYFNVLENRRNR